MMMSKKVDWISLVLSAGCVFSGGLILWNFFTGRFVPALAFGVSEEFAFWVLWVLTFCGFGLGVWFWLGFFMDKNEGGVLFGEEKSDEEKSEGLSEELGSEGSVGSEEESGD